MALAIGYPADVGRLMAQLHGLVDRGTADVLAMPAYLAGQNPDSRRRRIHAAVNPAAPFLLRCFTGVADPRPSGFVAVKVLDDGEVIIGEAQCVVAIDDSSAEFAISVVAAQRGSGIAGELMSAALTVAEAASVESVHSDVFAGNARMSAFMAHQGFTLDAGAGNGAGRRALQALAEAGIGTKGARGAGRRW